MRNLNSFYLLFVVFVILVGCGKPKEFSAPSIQLVIKNDDGEHKFQSIKGDSTEHIIPISAGKEYEVIASAFDSTELQLVHIVFSKCVVVKSDATKVEDSSLPHKKDVWNSNEDKDLGNAASFKTVITSNSHFTAAELRAYATDIFGNVSWPVVIRFEVQ